MCIYIYIYRHQHGWRYGYGYARTELPAILEHRRAGGPSVLTLTWQYAVLCTSPSPQKGTTKVVLKRYLQTPRTKLAGIWGIARRLFTPPARNWQGCKFLHTQHYHACKCIYAYIYINVELPTFRARQVTSTCGHATVTARCSHTAAEERVR